MSSAFHFESAGRYFVGYSLCPRRERQRQTKTELEGGREGSPQGRKPEFPSVWEKVESLFHYSVVF